ncbi:hypothetical protein R1sor_017282 [Riccia sorocarpa]|uniref:Uncharacterized protein n=1 Tax=Riccia sorocarpa TaxID=122646 RepID=A0ABD3IA41_9MARC
MANCELLLPAATSSPNLGPYPNVHTARRFIPAGISSTKLPLLSPSANYSRLLLSRVSRIRDVKCQSSRRIGRQLLQGFNGGPMGGHSRTAPVVKATNSADETPGDGIELRIAEDEEETTKNLPSGWAWNKTSKELIAYMLLIAAVPIVPFLPRFEWSGAFYFLFLAVWSVYVGSHRSLSKKPPQKMSLNQGLAVPLFCSASLFGFYCLLRFFPDLDVRSFISAYLGVAGAVAVGSNVVEPIRRLLPNSESLSFRVDFPAWLVQDEGQPVHLTLTPADLIAGSVGILATIASKQAGAPFTLKNFIAVCIVTELLQLLSLGTFTTAAVMLSGLLLYDVFWVFGSSHVFGDNVMVTVATSSAFDGPMKLIFPRFGEGPTLNPYSILGLGDIAAPGLLIAMMLRFDRHRAKNSKEVLENSSPDKTYFITCLASYVFGLTVTVVANTVSGAAQPALLYLVPSLLLGVFAVAAFRSEASLLLDYKDETLMSIIPVKSEDETAKKILESMQAVVMQAPLRFRLSSSFRT